MAKYTHKWMIYFVSPPYVYSPLEMYLMLVRSHINISIVRDDIPRRIVPFTSDHRTSSPPIPMGLLRLGRIQSQHPSQFLRSQQKQTHGRRPHSQTRSRKIRSRSHRLRRLFRRRTGPKFTILNRRTRRRVRRSPKNGRR